MPRVPFRKPALPLDDQVALLARRGLEIADEARARHYLENISYYRLSGYTRYFSDPGDQRQERFRPGVKFEDVVDLYVFDRRLRVLIAEALERIEIAVKGGLAYHGSVAAGPFWMSDPANFDAGCHAHVAAIINEAIKRSEDGHYKQVFLDAFFSKCRSAARPSSTSWPAV